MNKFLIVFFVLTSYHLNAQILPRENSKLNYRIIGFMVPQSLPGNTYNIQIALGHYTTTASFEKNIIASFPSGENRVVGEVPFFGKEYTWRNVVTDVHSVKTPGQLHYFSTMTAPEVDTNFNRLRITKEAETYKDAYIFSDDARTLYDMQGKPVWFIPEPQGVDKMNKKLYGNFKATHQGTITFGYIGNKDERLYEVNYNGDILWKSPKMVKLPDDSISNETIESAPVFNGNYMSRPYSKDNCHRDFAKLPNGNYLVLESNFVWLKLPADADDDVLEKLHKKYGIPIGGSSGLKIKRHSNGQLYQRVEFTRLIEYDANVNEVWSWNSLEYMFRPDVYSHLAIENVFHNDDMHENAFYFDEKSKMIYISFRNISSIIKIKYPSGEVLNSYPDRGYEQYFFCNQHNCELTQEGYLSVYNNNDCSGSLPTLVLLEMPIPEKNTLNKIWEYQCTDEGLESKKVRNWGARGSVKELPDHSILACMPSEIYTKLFIVSRDKKVLWSAFPERWDQKEKVWKTIFEYRTSIILNKKELERLIWNIKPDANKAN